MSQYGEHHESGGDQQSYRQRNRGGKRYVFTINNPGPEQRIMLQELESSDGVDRIIGVLEHNYDEPAGHEGSWTPHYQGAIMWKATTRWVACLAKLGGSGIAHVEHMKGTWEQARDYCLKDVKVDQAQIIVQKNLGTAQGKRTDLSRIKEVIDAKYEAGEVPSLLDVFEEDFSAGVRYCRGFGTYISLMDRKQAKKKGFRQIKVTVHWGRGGTGKSRRARCLDDSVAASPTDPASWTDHPSYFSLEAERKWFDGYEGETRLIVDDFQGEISYPRFKQLLDGYQQALPVKGGFVQAQWTEVVITSNVDPDMWFKDFKKMQDIGPTAGTIWITQAENEDFSRRLDSVQYHP